jgi:hypothetical protein
MNGSIDPSGLVPMVCGVCSQPLNRVLPMADNGSFTGEAQYRHRPGEYDHEPQPQPAAEHFAEGLDMVCEFCNGPDPVWSYFAPGITMHALDDADEMFPVSDYGDRWAACTECANLIEHDNRPRLLDRSIPSGVEPEVRALVEGLHTAFFLARRGKRRRLRR